MSWAAQNAKTATPYRTDQGEGWSNFPQDSGMTEYKGVLAGCAGCSKKDDHNACEVIAGVIPRGSSRSDVVPASTRLRREDVEKLEGALWLAGYVHQWYDDGALIYGDGQGNNSYQYKQFKIVSVSGSTLTLYGENPRKLAISVRSPNPDWPAEGGRLNTSTVYVGLPAGAMVRFLAPSCLERKLAPYIVSVDAPESEDAEVEFDVELSASVSAALQARDAAFPASEYYVRIWWPELNGFGYERVESQGEAQFSPRVVTVSRETAEAGPVELLDSAGASTRILYNAMTPDIFRVFTREDSGSSWFKTGLGDGDLTTAQGASGWTTHLDFTAALVDEDWTEARIEFWAETTASDTRWLQWQSHCANDQLADRGHDHDGGRRCTRVESSQFGTYRAECWQPDCDGFSGGVGTSAFGNRKRQQADFLESKHYGVRVWTRQGLVISQGIPGFAGPSNFSVGLPSGGGPSLASLVGGWSAGVPSGNFASKEPLRPPAFGQRVVTVDDGDYDQDLRFGLFAAQPSSDDPYVAGSPPTDGAAPELVSGWKSRTAADGSARPAELRHLPDYAVGRCHLHNWTAAGGGLMWVNRLRSGQEFHIANIDTDADVRALVVERFG